MTAQQQVVPSSAGAEISTRLPMPQGMASDFDLRKWRVLCETTFPSARTPEAIVMALDYCRARGLDVFKRPVHIVPMWNSTLKREVETVWAGINEIQTTAARTGAWAGMDEPKWGNDVIGATFKGRMKDKDGWENREVCINYPDWCAVTVYRMIAGQRCAFTEPVYWLEAYSRAGGSDLPTPMWVKRPRGQLHKVAKAASLRAAFPEEGEYTAEEMEGTTIDAGGIVIDHEPANAKPAKRTMAEISANKKRREDECAGVQKDLSQIETLSELERYQAEHLTPQFMASLGNAQWAVEEWLEARRAELGEPAEDGKDKPEYIRHCHVVIEEAKDEKTLLDWWNSKEQKAARRLLELTKEELADLMARTMEKREWLLKPHAEVKPGEVVMEAGG